MERSEWERLDLVRGLPRSKENHATNGLALDPGSNTLFVAQGANTNQGAPSKYLGFLPEYALSGAILAVDLAQVEERPHDLPTLDDDSRDGERDAGDPFGGNDARNQARLEPGGPVTVYAPGYRNAYDLVLTKSDGSTPARTAPPGTGATHRRMKARPARAPTQSANRGITTEIRFTSCVAACSPATRIQLVGTGPTRSTTTASPRSRARTLSSATIGDRTSAAR